MRSLMRLLVLLALAAIVTSCTATRRAVNIIVPIDAQIEVPTMTVLDGAKASENHRGLILDVDVTNGPELYGNARKQCADSLRDTLMASGYLDQVRGGARYRAVVTVKGIYYPGFSSVARTKILYQLVPVGDAAPKEFEITTDGIGENADISDSGYLKELARAHAFQENFRKFLAELAALD